MNNGKVGKKNKWENCEEDFFKRLGGRFAVKVRRPGCHSSSVTSSLN